MTTETGSNRLRGLREGVLPALALLLLTGCTVRIAAPPPRCTEPR